MPSLIEPIRGEEIRIEPDKFIVSTEDVKKRVGKIDPGTVEYWFEYIPPAASPDVLTELQQSGYIMPTEKIETTRQTFVVH